MGHRNYLQSEIKTTDAKQLADVSLVVLDLKSVMALCRRGASELAKTESEHDHVLIEALWTAGLIKYVRCFTSGKRATLSADVFSSYEGGVDTHEYFKSMRDKHVAHSVNPFEEAHVAVVLSADDGKPRSAEGVSVFSRRHISPKADGFNTLGRLAEVAHRHVAEQGKNLQDKISAWAKTQPIDVFSVSNLQTTAPGPAEARTPRK
jgi:hypothetical protein